MFEGDLAICDTGCDPAIEAVNASDAGAAVPPAADIGSADRCRSGSRDRAATRSQSVLGARTIHTHLCRAGTPHVPAVSTIHCVLQRYSLIPPRRQRRAVSAWRRFERYAPNDLWQIDGTQLALSNGSLACVIDILDDHARYASAPPPRDSPWTPPGGRSKPLWPNRACRAPGSTHIELRSKKPPRRLPQRCG